jgi:hypothetical protein
MHIAQLFDDWCRPGYASRYGSMRRVRYGRYGSSSSNGIGNGADVFGTAHNCWESIWDCVACACCCGSSTGRHESHLTITTMSSVLGAHLADTMASGTASGKRQFSWPELRYMMRLMDRAHARSPGGHLGFRQFRHFCLDTLEQLHQEQGGGGARSGPRTAPPVAPHGNGGPGKGQPAEQPAVVALPPRSAMI